MEFNLFNMLNKNSRGKLSEESSKGSNQELTKKTSEELYKIKNKNIKLNLRKLKRRNINKIPAKFSLANPLNLVKQINASSGSIKRGNSFEAKSLLKYNTKINRRKENSLFSITIVPHSSSNVRTFKISNLYFKFALAWVLFIALSVYSLSYLINTRNENKFLKANLDDLYSMNIKQASLLNDKYIEIKKLIEENDTTTIDIAELSTKYRDIVDKYIDGRISGGIASRSGDRSGNTFLSDVKELNNILTELSEANASKEKTLIDLTESEKKLKIYLDSLPTQWPVNGRISSKFGQRRDPITYRLSFHKGIDIAASYGVNIKAAGSGKVIFVGSYNEYGQTVIIDHGDGLKSLYGHASKILVKKGQSVTKETVIAKVGSSGRSTGAHLHFEIRLNDNPVDPLKYLEK